MTARERKASEGTSATLTAHSAVHETARCAIRNGAAAPLPHAFAWDEWFAHAGQGQREEMLALAARQGVIYASQFPTLVNGRSKSAPEISPHACMRLLSAKAEELAPVETETVAILDQELDAAQ